MDAGSVNGMIFLNGMGLGFDAQVAAENYTEPGKVKKGGKHKYIWHIVKTILFFREKRMKMISDQSTSETDCFINTISIGTKVCRRFLPDTQSYCQRWPSGCLLNKETESVSKIQDFSESPQRRTY